MIRLRLTRSRTNSPRIVRLSATTPDKPPPAVVVEGELCRAQDAAQDGEQTVSAERAIRAISLTRAAFSLPASAGLGATHDLAGFIGNWYFRIHQAAVLAGQIECFYFLTSPGGATQETQAGFHAGLMAEAVDRQAFCPPLPTIKADQFREQALQRDAV